MLRRLLLSLSAAAIAGLIGTSSAGAQIRGSEQAVTAQTVDGTTVTLEYSRPVARGRKIFGELVPWNQPWTGANWATTLEIDKDIRLNGAEVPTGKYSVWVIPREGQWTVFLDPNHKLFHFQKPDSTDKQIHVAVSPETGPHVELLTWSFPAVTGDAAQLRMQWGTTSMPLQIVVQPSKAVALSEEDRGTYIGAYDLQLMEGMGWPVTGKLEVFDKDGVLRGRMPFPVHPGDELEFDLVPAGSQRFNPGLYRDGKLFNIEMGASFEFDVDGERATTVRLRGIEGTVFGSGVRAGNGK
jgi:hypothetical protein